MGLIYRFIVHYRLHQISTNQTSRLFRTKLTQFKQKELQKSMVTFGVALLSVVILLMIAMIQLTQLEIRVQGVTTHTKELRGNILKLKRKSSSSVSQLKDYPSKGLALESRLKYTEQTLAEKEATERKLATYLCPYISEAQWVLSSGSDADSLTATIMGRVEATGSDLVILGKNLTALMREIEGIPSIIEVHISIVDNEERSIYKGTYLRNDTGYFTFRSELRKGNG